MCSASGILNFLFIFLYLYLLPSLLFVSVLLWEAFAGEAALDGLVLRDLTGCPYP